MRATPPDATKYGAQIARSGAVPLRRPAFGDVTDRQFGISVRAGRDSGSLDVLGHVAKAKCDRPAALSPGIGTQALRASRSEIGALF
jgi:hypothetical protein